MSANLLKECQVCIAVLTPKQKHIVCPSCEYVACEVCQTAFASIPRNGLATEISCMNCRYEFRPFIIQKLFSKKFLEKVYRPNLIKELMLQQEADLESVDVQSFIKYYQECAEIRKKSRFGARQIFPPKPERTRNFVSIRYHCPYLECRGMVLGETCNVCKRDSCIKCHCPCVDKSNHVCDADAIYTLNGSKPCPKCWVPIFRT